MTLKIEEQKTITISERLLNGLMADAEARGLRNGLEQATAIQLGESSYGAVRSAVIVIDFTSFQALRREIRNRRWYRSGDNPGQAYRGGCELIAIHHGDYSKQAIAIVSTAYDI